MGRAGLEGLLNPAESPRGLDLRGSLLSQGNSLLRGSGQGRGLSGEPSTSGLRESMSGVPAVPPRILWTIPTKIAAHR